MQYEIDHPFVGKTMVNSEGKRYNIEKAFIEESEKYGKFLKFLIENNKSHGVVYWEAYTSVPQWIDETIQDCRENYFVEE